MENKSTPEKDFENYMRKNLLQADPSPDNDLWNKIAAKQARPNIWLKFRKYILPLAGAAILIVAVSIWNQEKPLPAAPNSPVAPVEIPLTAPGSPEMAASPAPVSVKHVNTKTPTDTWAFVPEFSPRKNSVPASSITFNTSNGLYYQSPVTGTSIQIPANSLVDRHGRPVSGEAELLFREYRTPAEFLASGLPMHYGDSRGDFFFNSGGMFEVRVSQAGEPLQMAKRQNFTVSFTPTNQLESASLYYLEDDSKQWQFIPDAAFGQADLQQPPIVTEELAVAGNQRPAQGDCLPAIFEISADPDPAEMVKRGVQTGYDLATGKITMPTWFLKNPYLTDDQLLFKLERGAIQIKKHRDKSQLFFPEDINKYFTELDAFKNCYFSFNLDSLGGGKNLGENVFQEGKYWQRIVVKQEKNAKCIITLYDGKEGQLQYHAVLRGNTENKNFDPDKVLAEYNRLRAQRQQDFAEKNKGLRYFLLSAGAFKPKSEWCMSVYEWLAHFEKSHPMMAKRYEALLRDGYGENNELAEGAWNKWKKTLRETRFSRPNGFVKDRGTALNNLQYSLALFKFGVYNCDQIFRMLNSGEGQTYILAMYKTSTGERVVPATISVMDASSRLFVTQPSPSHLLYVQGRKLDVVITDRNGKQFLLRAKDYASQKIYKASVNSFTVTDVTDQTGSPQGWAETLNM